MNLRLLRQELYWSRVRLLVVGLAAFGWGLLIPIVYVQFSEIFRDLANSGAFPEELMNFGSGSLFTLEGSMTLGLQHPLAIAFLGIFAVGVPVSAIAAARERGTLEVLLSRPLSRRTVYLTEAIAVLVLVGIVLALLLAGQVTGAALQGVVDEIDLPLMPLVYLNGLMLWGAFAAFALAASVSFDRGAPAIGLSLSYLLVNYFLEILGSLWRDVAWSQEYSLFHHFQPSEILTGKADLLDLAILGAAVLIPAAYAWIIFPRRDLAAPA